MRHFGRLVLGAGEEEANGGSEGEVAKVLNQTGRIKRAHIKGVALLNGLGEALGNGLASVVVATKHSVPDG